MKKIPYIWWDWNSFGDSICLAKNLFSLWLRVQRDLAMENTTKGEQSHLLSKLQKEYSQRLNLSHLNCFGHNCSEEVDNIEECTEVNDEEGDGEQNMFISSKNGTRQNRRYNAQKQLVDMEEKNYCVLYYYRSRKFFTWINFHPINFFVV